MTTSAKKMEFNKYMSDSGGNKMLAQAVVGLSKACLKNGALKPAEYLRDFFVSGVKGPPSANFGPDEKEKVERYMRTSGANDLFAKALMALYDASARPTFPADYFKEFFITFAARVFMTF